MATITLHPSQVVAEESTYDSVNADAPLTKPIGKGTTNATYAEIYLAWGRQAQTYVTYRFNTSSIPAGATIKKVTLRAKGDVETEDTNRISITRVSLLSGQDVLAESNDYAFGQMASVAEAIATNVTRAQLDDAKIKLFAQRGGWYVNNAYFMRFYGADLIVEYEAGTTPPDPEPEPEPKPPDPEPEPTPTDKTHAVLINGTTYSVQGGRALVNGTAVDIKGGRALVNGTGVDILFKTEAETLTWKLNENIDKPNGELVAEFTCRINGSLWTYYGMIAEYDANEDTQMLHYYLNKEGSRTDNAYNFSTFKWDNVGYQTITFKQMPSGALLSWLNNNGRRVK